MVNRREIIEGREKNGLKWCAMAPEQLKVRYGKIRDIEKTENEIE